MLDWLKENAALVVAVASGGMAGNVLTLVVQHLKRPRKEVSHHILSRQVIEASHPKLTVLYEERPIGSLSSHTILFGNTGSGALKDLPVQLLCDTGSEIVDFAVQSPPGEDYKSELSDDRRALRVHCDLLNRREPCEIGLTTIRPDGSPVAVSFFVRQEDLVVKQKPDFFEPIISPAVLEATMKSVALWLACLATVAFLYYVATQLGLVAPSAPRSAPFPP